MKRKLAKSVCILTLAGCCAGVDARGQAGAQPLVPLPSVPDFTRGMGWGLALGAGVEYETAYDGADEYEFEVDPAGALQWRRGNHLLFWEVFELGWRGRIADPWLLQAGARYEDGLEADDSDDGNLDGLPDRDSHIVGFAEVRRAVGPDWRNWVGGRVLGGGSDFGWLGVLAAGHRLGPHSDGTGLEAIGFATFGNDAFLNKDFGVSAGDSAATGLPETEPNGGHRSVGLTLLYRYNVTDQFQLVAEGGVELYSGDVQDSPIARDDYEFETGLSVVWII